MESVTGDTLISDLHLWRVGQDKHACILAVVAKSPRSVTAYKTALQAVHELAHVTIEVMPRNDAPAA